MLIADVLYWRRRIYRAREGRCDASETDRSSSRTAAAMIAFLVLIIILVLLDFERLSLATASWLDSTLPMNQRRKARLQSVASEKSFIRTGVAAPGDLDHKVRPL